MKRVPQPGEWWYSVFCAKCKTTLTAYHDNTDGKSPAKMINGTIELGCPVCAHRVAYPVEEFKSRMVPAV